MKNKLLIIIGIVMSVVGVSILTPFIIGGSMGDGVLPDIDTSLLDEEECIIEDVFWNDIEGICEFDMKGDIPTRDGVPIDRLQIRHSAGYTTVYITLSSWDEYNEWEKNRRGEHDAMPPVIIDDDNINPIVSDLLNEMWKFEDYEVSKRDDNLFTKKIQKDYSVANHHEISDWLEFEYEKQFGKSNDGVSHYFEYGDKVYTVIMLAVD